MLAVVSVSSSLVLSALGKVLQERNELKKELATLQEEMRENRKKSKNVAVKRSQTVRDVTEKGFESPKNFCGTK